MLSVDLFTSDIAGFPLNMCDFLEVMFIFFPGSSVKVSLRERQLSFPLPPPMVHAHKSLSMLGIPVVGEEPHNT